MPMRLRHLKNLIVEYIIKLLKIDVYSLQRREHAKDKGQNYG